MVNSLSKIVAVFLAVVIMFIYPTMHMFDQQDFTTRQLVLAETTKFVDSVRNIGYITPNMYLEFTQALSLTSNLYDIQLEHKHRKYDPVYDDPLDRTTFQNDFNLNYVDYYTNEIMEHLFTEDIISQTKYHMSEGDYFLVKVKNKNKTIGTKMKQLLYGVNLPKEVICIQYGGMIKNEAY